MYASDVGLNNNWNESSRAAKGERNRTAVQIAI